MSWSLVLSLSFVGHAMSPYHSDHMFFKSFLEESVRE